MKNVKAGHTRPIVCIDAGHYAKYNRSPVVSQYYESEMNWKLHLLLKAELEKYGIQVTTTRVNQSKDMALTDRGRASKGADLFLSLHSNAADSEAVKYVVAMYQVDDNCGEMDEQSREMADILAQTVGEVMDLPWQTWTTKSSSDRDGNGYKDDYYGVLRGAHEVHTPGVIIEHGFHTNAATARWLLVNENLEKLAKAEAEVIAQYFDVAKGVPAEETPTEGTYTLDQFIRDVQRACGAAVDGIAGPETIGKTPTISAQKNRTHAVVKPVQKRLYTLGYTIVGQADGIAGPKFTAAVTAFQEDNKCWVDGEITARNKTWKKLLGMS